MFESKALNVISALVGILLVAGVIWETNLLRPTSPTHVETGETYEMLVYDIPEPYLEKIEAAEVYNGEALTQARIQIANEYIDHISLIQTTRLEVRVLGYVGDKDQVARVLIDEEDVASHEGVGGDEYEGHEIHYMPSENLEEL